MSEPTSDARGARRGVFIPLITPLDEAGDVCKTSVAHLVAHVRPSASGLLPCLTSGEGWLLSRAQWEAMVRATLAAAGSLPVIVGAERQTTEEVIECGRLARQLGAKGIMLTSPFGKDVPQQRIFEHFRAVHDTCDLDVYIYNETSLAGTATTFETLMAIAELPRVVGIKDSIEAGRPVSEISALQRQNLAYYIGWEHHLGKGLPVDGSVVSMANLEPAICKLGLASAEPAVHAEVLRLNEVYSLAAADWYRHIKQSLWARGIIATPHTVTAS